MDSTQIMMSLQVQDITSQQLAAVNSLLQTVQSKLGEIMVHFRNTEIGELITASTRRPVQEETHATQVSSLHRAVAFDSDVGSALSGDPNRQNDVDSILASFQSGGSIPNDTTSSQNDVDALLNSIGIPTQASVPIASSHVSPSPGADPASQDDIDALFGGGKANDSASQDDIDALFK
jgi:chemotaxis regulatin CheY-phosphate phosphatase CheZ